MGFGSRVTAGIAYGLSLLLAAGAAGAQLVTSAEELCTGDPCVIDSSADVVDGSILNFGDRDVILQAKLDIGQGGVDIVARSLEVRRNGRILGKGGSTGVGGILSITTSGPITLGGSATGGVIQLTGCDGGELGLQSSSGDVVVTHKLDLSRIVGFPCSPDGFGGTLSVDAQNIELRGRLDLEGGRNGAGGIADLIATGLVRVDNASLSGGDFDAALSIVTDGDVRIGDVALDGDGEFGAGGTLEVLTTAGTITVAGKVTVRGSNSLISGGDGGIVDLDAAGPTSEVHVLDSVVARGRGPDGCGGEFSASAGYVEVAARIDAGAASDCPGSVDLSGLLAVELKPLGFIDVSAADAFGASVSVSSAGVVALDGEIDARATGGGGSTGGSVSAISLGSLHLGSAQIDASSPNVADGGDIDLVADSVTADPGVTLRADGVAGQVAVSGCRQIVLAGSFEAGGSNVVRFRDGALAPDLSGAVFTPSPTIEPSQTIPICVPEAGGWLQALAAALAVALPRVRRRRTA